LWLEKFRRTFAETGSPSSGLGEVFTYALAFKPNSIELENSAEARLRHLKLVQEFVVKPCLKSVKGVADINTTGGFDQVMVVEVDPLKLPEIGYDMNDIAVLMARDVSVVAARWWNGTETSSSSAPARGRRRATNSPIAVSSCRGCCAPSR